ncbi:Phosphatidic acid phosphatase type 2/haloperoxidase [gut metagenome]|uniref:Phosphatidic acid phosphatase type 2/haloperoxidase n=1 Tax=gut metagenome TaxID=749906 RepID=J9GW44_9ZZZZ
MLQDWTASYKASILRWAPISAIARRCCHHQVLMVFSYDLIVMTQASGERPTAAFPSSHVGISTILMFLLYRDNRRLLWIALPFYIFLCCATVYIQAHYLVDVFGGFLSAIVIYTLTSRLYPWMTRTSPEFQLAVALP